MEDAAVHLSPSLTVAEGWGEIRPLHGLELCLQKCLEGTGFPLRCGPATLHWGECPEQEHISQDTWSMWASACPLVPQGRLPLCGLDWEHCFPGSTTFTGSTTFIIPFLCHLLISSEAWVVWTFFCVPTPLPLSGGRSLITVLREIYGCWLSAPLAPGSDFEEVQTVSSEWPHWLSF